MINQSSLTSASKTFLCQTIFPFIQNINSNNKELINTTSNNLNIFNINSETYYFNKRMKSRFFDNQNSKENLENNFESFSTKSDSNSNKSDSENKNYLKEKNDDVMYIKQKNKKKKKISNLKKGNKGKFYKGFKERDGDWTCYYCKNLNFTFRNECNRCHITKETSDKGHEQYFQNVLNQLNVNEEKRKKIINYHN